MSFKIKTYLNLIEREEVVASKFKQIVRNGAKKISLYRNSLCTLFLSIFKVKSDRTLA
jgi:hypothetical protein